MLLYAIQTMQEQNFMFEYQLQLDDNFTFKGKKIMCLII